MRIKFDFFIKEVDRAPRQLPHPQVTQTLDFSCEVLTIAFSFSPGPPAAKSPAKTDKFLPHQGSSR
jgi:hypothetical protein